MEIKTFTYKRKGGKYYEDRMFGDDMDTHIKRMIEAGWEPMNSADDAGHVRVGRTVGAAVLTGGLSLLFGASRTAPTITLTFRKG